MRQTLDLLRLGVASDELLEALSNLQIHELQDLIRLFIEPYLKKMLQRSDLAVEDNILFTYDFPNAYKMTIELSDLFMDKSEFVVNVRFHTKVYEIGGVIEKTNTPKISLNIKEKRPHGFRLIYRPSNPIKGLYCNGGTANWKTYIKLLISNSIFSNKNKN